MDTQIRDIILMIAGGVLIIFGMIASYRKDIGGAIVSIPGGKVEGGNSGMLVTIIGAVMLLIGATSYYNKTTGRNMPVEPADPISDSGPGVPVNEVCSQLDLLLGEINTNINSLRGERVGQYGSFQVYRSNKSIMNFPAYLKIAPGTKMLEIDIPEAQGETSEHTWLRYAQILDDCYSNSNPHDQYNQNYDGNTYTYRFYNLNEKGLMLMLWLRTRYREESPITPVSLHILPM